MINFACRFFFFFLLLIIHLETVIGEANMIYAMKLDFLLRYLNLFFSQSIYIYIHIYICLAS